MLWHFELICRLDFRSSQLIQAHGRKEPILSSAALLSCCQLNRLLFLHVGPHPDRPVIADDLFVGRHLGNFEGIYLWNVLSKPPA